MKRLVKVSFILASAALLLSSCNCYTKMVKKIDDVKITCNPEVLALKGSNVPVDITVEFPAKYFKKKGTLKVTPVLVFNGGEIAGTPKFFQGEKVKDNYTVISYKGGGKYTQSITLPYDERAKLSTLELRIDAKCKKGDFKPVAALAVAQGISTVQLLANNTAYMTIMPDNYKRVTTISQDADIMYLVNRYNVRPAELTKEQVKMFEEFVKEYSDKDRATLGNIYAKGYASPEGPVAFNDKLSKERSVSGKDAISKALSGVDAKYDVAAYGEDWEGFKKLVAASNIKEKDLILQVLSMYSNPVKRDEEIRNMTSVFTVLKEKILPELRRTQLIADVDIEGRTDAEIKTAAAGNIDVLTLEEMLYAATLTNDNAAKIKAYQAAARKFNDARAYNNLGVIYAKEWKLAEAKTAFDKAASISRSADITNNLGALALMNGNVAGAKRMLSSLNTPDAKANMGLVNLAEGNYAEAARSLKGYNLAVAETLNQNYARAISALGNDKSAEADYLRAVIAMRNGDANAATAMLKSSISKNPSMKAKAANDIEFAKLFGTTTFLAL